jgi:hypothetical protein
MPPDLLERNNSSQEQHGADVHHPEGKHNVHMTAKEGIAIPMVTGTRPIDPAWRASASHAPPAMSKRAATKGLMCERDDWVPFGGAACLLLMIFLQLSQILS